MSAPVPNSTLKAARRWIELLRVSSYESARALLGSESRYADLSRTQYGAGFDILSELGLVSKPNLGLGDLAAIPVDDLCAMLYGALLKAAPPPWLPDSDILINSPVELPSDAIGAGAALGLGESLLLNSIRSAHGKVDISARQEVGLIGEELLVGLLEAEWPDSTAHISLVDDGAGYDIAFSASGCELHLEVKTTTRRGRLVFYLSRNEHEVALRDPHWRLALVGLAGDRTLGAIACVDYRQLAAVVPLDRDFTAQWQSVRFEIGAHQTQPGIPGLPMDDAAAADNTSSPLVTGAVAGINFGWLTT